MNTNELTKEPHERLVEVLLEEEFRGRRAVHAAPTGRGPSRWLAAAVVLLGLCVVGGVMTMRGGGADPDHAVPVQGPTPPATPQEPAKPLKVTKSAELAALLPLVKRVRLQVAQRWRPDFVGLPEATTVIDDPESVRAFIALAPTLADGPSMVLDVPGASLRLSFELANGTLLHGGVAIDNHVFWVSELEATPLEPGAFLDLVTDLYFKALANYRIAHGITQSLAELARVPATAKSIRCLPLPPGTVMKHLGRFSQLERLDLEITTTLGSGPQAITIPAPIRIDEYLALPNLRHFHFPGNGLVDADATALARMKNLTSVRIDGGLGDLSEIGMRTLVTNLDAIELVSVKNGNAVVRAAIAAGRLRKLALFDVELTTDEFAALVAMPTLRDLDLTGIWWQDNHLAQLLAAKTPLERLRLRSTEITAAGLRTLTAAPSLVELDLRQAGLRTEALDDLQKDLQQRLPNCRIRRPGEPNDDPTSPGDIPGRTRR